MAKLGVKNVGYDKLEVADKPKSGTGSRFICGKYVVKAKGLVVVVAVLSFCEGSDASFLNVEDVDEEDCEDLSIMSSKRLGRSFNHDISQYIRRNVVTPSRHCPIGKEKA